MPASLSIDSSHLLLFALTVSRMAGMLVFLPVPGLRGIPEGMRPMVAVALGASLFADTRIPLVSLASPPAILLACLAELSLGLLWGLAVHFLIEAFVLGAQFLALQAGFGYASIVDPATQADAGLLQMLAQLTASLLFFASGLHREVLFLMAESLRRIPPGGFVAGPITGNGLIALGGEMFEIAARLAMPLLALLILVDIALALMGRVQSQLQLLPMAFPAKLLVSLLVLGMLAGTHTSVFFSFKTEILRFLAGVVTIGG